jgi:16S rRNA (uracil1498-N3)-methyltransferase
MTVHRFHVPEAAPGSRVLLPEHTAHHAREVLRLRAGAAVRVFDGSGREFEAALEEVTRQRVLARLGGPVPPRPESPLRVVLALPPLKGDRMELVIQKATELGVAEIWPVVTARTDAAGRPALHGSRQERWERVASGAAEQCGRAVVPAVAPTTTLDALLARPVTAPRMLFLAASDAPALVSGGIAPRSVLALIGPAGGWEDAEVTRLAQAGFERKGLGPRTLRSETAAIAAVTCLQVIWGDLAPRQR